jgi:serine/threonine-protein kinase RsbW
MENLGAEQTGSSWRLDVVYDSDLKSVDSAEAAILEQATRLGFSEDGQHELGIALREAMVNAVVHGNKYSAHKKVRMKASIEDGGLKIVISDEGTGFELNRVPDPREEENLLKESGRGILLMQAFVDEFQVRRLQPHGTEVTMVKYAASH